MPRAARVHLVRTPGKSGDLDLEDLLQAQGARRATERGLPNGLLVYGCHVADQVHLYEIETDGASQPANLLTVHIVSDVRGSEAASS